LISASVYNSARAPEMPTDASGRHRQWPARFLHSDIDVVDALPRLCQAVNT
jgi:hypothetical protein